MSLAALFSLRPTRNIVSSRHSILHLAILAMSLDSGAIAVINDKAQTQQNAGVSDYLAKFHSSIPLAVPGRRSSPAVASSADSVP